MSEFTLTDLKTLMQDILDEPIDLDGDIHDVPFTELGYDSLGLLELATRVEIKHGVAVPDEVMPGLRTPRALLNHVAAAQRAERDL